MTPKPGSLAALLAQAKTVKSDPAPAPTPVIQPEPASSVVSSEGPTTSDAVKVAESVTAVTSQASTPDTPSGSLTKLLSTPKPEVVSRIPTVEQVEHKMRTLEEIAGVIDENAPDPTGPERFKFQLDLLDKKMSADDGKLDMFNIDSVRGIIARIMMDWKANPSYDGLVIDRDTHNILSFMYQTQVRATETLAAKATKAEKTATTSKKRTQMAKSIMEIDFGDF